MGLISKEAVLKHLNDVWLTNTPKGSYDMQAAKAEGIAIAMKAVEDFRTVPAVPLEPLCEWLDQHEMKPAVCLGKLCGKCEYDKYGSYAECWKKVLTEWMEEQDAAD